MYKILIPTDFSSNADNAIDYALHIAEKQPSEIFLLHVFHAPLVDAQMPGSIMTELVKNEEKESNSKLKYLIKKINSQKKYAHIKYRHKAVFRSNG